jgi:hypothetical protein
MSHHPAPRPLTLLLAGALAASGWVAPPAQGANHVDGTYSGMSVVTAGAETGRCGQDFKVVVKVADSEFLTTWDVANNIILGAKIAPDGSVTGETFFSTAPGAKATGRLSGRALEVDLTGKQCARHLSLTKA